MDDRVDTYMIKPGKGVIAVCSRGLLGLITEDEPKLIEYGNGDTGFAWVGIQLTSADTPIGSPWSSRNPEAIGRIVHLEDKEYETLFPRRNGWLIDGR